MNLEEARDWVNRLGGAVVGLAAGLAWSLKITGKLVALGEKMGTHVLQAARLAVQISRQYQTSTQREATRDGRLRDLERATFGKEHPVEDEEQITIPATKPGKREKGG